jgi:hypothetical protein
MARYVSSTPSAVGLERLCEALVTTHGSQHVVPRISSEQKWEDTTLRRTPEGFFHTSSPQTFFTLLRVELETAARLLSGVRLVGLFRTVLALPLTVYLAKRKEWPVGCFWFLFCFPKDCERTEPYLTRVWHYTLERTLVSFSGLGERIVFSVVINRVVYRAVVVFSSRYDRSSEMT